MDSLVKLAVMFPMDAQGTPNRMMSFDMNDAAFSSRNPFAARKYPTAIIIPIVITISIA